MSKHTKRQVNELCFPTCVLLPCLSPQFAFYFLSSYDGLRKRVSISILMQIRLFALDCYEVILDEAKCGKSATDKLVVNKLVWFWIVLDQLNIFVIVFPKASRFIRGDYNITIFTSFIMAHTQAHKKLCRSTSYACTSRDQLF